jgi:hypothetical protein
MLAKLIAEIDIQNTAVTMWIIYFNIKEIYFFPQNICKHTSCVILQ